MTLIAASKNDGISWLSVLDKIKFHFFLASAYFFRMLLDLLFLRCVIFQHINEPMFQANSSCFYLTQGIP